MYIYFSSTITNIYRFSYVNIYIYIYVCIHTNYLDILAIFIYKVHKNCLYFNKIKACY